MSRQREGMAYRFAAAVLRPLMVALTRQDWRGLEHLPSTGGVIVAPNHISYVDPLVVAHVLHDRGRPPRFLAKVALFSLPLLGRILRGAEQIPVHRQTSDAGLALRHAARALERGQCVVVYPEGTVTRQADLWPMTGKTGAARLALTTGAPLVPLAHWGAQEILPPYAKRLRPFPRHTVHVRIGPPVDLSDLRAREPSTEVLREATDRLMSAITALLEEIRGERAPAERYDLRATGVTPTGNPARHRTRRSA